MRKLAIATLILMLAVPAFGWVITLTGSDTTYGNFYLPCSPRNGKVAMYVPALGGAKTLTVRGFLSGATGTYLNFYTGTGAMTQQTYTTPDNVAYFVETSWGAHAGTNFGYNILCSDNSVIGTTAYVFGECQ